MVFLSATLRLRKIGVGSLYFRRKVIKLLPPVRQKKPTRSSLLLYSKPRRGRMSLQCTQNTSVFSIRFTTVELLASRNLTLSNTGSILLSILLQSADYVLHQSGHNFHKFATRHGNICLGRFQFT